MKIICKNAKSKINVFCTVGVDDVRQILKIKIYDCVKEKSF